MLVPKPSAKHFKHFKVISNVYFHIFPQNAIFKAYCIISSELDRECYFQTFPFPTECYIFNAMYSSKALTTYNAVQFKTKRFTSFFLNECSYFLRNVLDTVLCTKNLKDILLLD